MAPVACSAPLAIKVGHIDDVQELRRATPTTVPHRYIRDFTERPMPIYKVPASIQVPVIDLAKISHINKGLSQHEIANLHAACREWGFFQVINHGIDSTLLQTMEKLAKDFFMLPIEEKEKYPMAPGTVQGYGHAFVFSEDQKLDWCNMLALGIEPHFIRNPKLWPTNPPKLRELCQKLLRFIALSLGLSPEVFNQMFGDAVQAVRMNYYPPCPRPDLVLGLSAHTDGSALTVLQQDMGAVGLQILKDTTWLPVYPIQNAFVINLGDTIEVLTNGLYKSVEHRAVTNREKDRLSIVTFYAPSYDIELGPLADFVDRNRPCLYKRYNHGEYSKHYIMNKLEGKKSLEFARIQANF